MFRDTRRKKLRNRVIFGVLGAFVLAFGLWLNVQSGEKDQQAEDVAKKVEVQETKEQDQKKSQEKSAAETEKQETPETYLVKEVDGVVKVFLCGDDGQQELYLITSIPFELLSEQDQELFEDGVTLETEEDLGKFLENFDS